LSSGASSACRLVQPINVHYCPPTALRSTSAGNLETRRFCTLGILEEASERFEHEMNILLGQIRSVLHPELDLMNTDSVDGANGKIGGKKSFLAIVERDVMVSHAFFPLVVVSASV
jgi:hypothetical protein